jgi:tryptophan-rich sensory protein
MAIFGFESDVALFIAIVGISFWHWGMETSASSKKNRKWYKAGRKHVWITPPGWVFGVMWFAIYIFEVTAMYRYVINQFPAALGNHMDSVVILYVVSSLLSRLWAAAFFHYKRVILSFVIVLLVFIMNVAITGIMIADEEVISYALMIIKCIWLLFATILSAWWIYVSKTNRSELTSWEMNDDSDVSDDDVSGSRKQKPGTVTTRVGRNAGGR